MNASDVMKQNNNITLYHSSKSGLKGDIAPISRERCDFGQGFYMGTERIQPLTLICNYENAKQYTLNANLSNLKLLNIDIGLEWALFVAFNRGKIDFAKETPIYQHFETLPNEYDMIIGYIANDRMFTVLDRFFRGDITDTALIHSLSALKLGKQYVAITKKACSQIDIVKEMSIAPEDRELLKIESERNRKSGIALANDICKKYRRDGRYFDEILQAGN